MTFLSDGPFETQEDLNAIKQKMTKPDDFMVSSIANAKFSSKGSVSVVRMYLALCFSVLDSSTSRSLCIVISASDQLKKKKTHATFSGQSEAFCY